MKIITVTQLNRYIKTLLEGDRNVASVYIGGEISNFTNHYKSGHLYMSLKDENALVRAVMFRGHAQRLTFTPENGMKVIVRAHVSLYEKDGSYQLYIEEMQPDGAGALQVAYEQLKARLQEEGLFDQSRKRPLPQYPRRVGVITSPTGAAVRDILNVLGRRWPLARVVFTPVLVQGDGAPPQLVEALERMNAQRAADVIIIGRGGGSLEELWAFNDGRVARAVAASTIPVISAVGHETDFTICDFAADMRAPTPSAAAELAVPDRAAQLTKLSQLQQYMAGRTENIVHDGQRRFSAVSGRRCLTSPLYYVEERAMRLDYVSRAFLGNMHTQTVRADRRLATAAAKLDALSPLKVLARGYAIGADENGNVLKSVTAVRSGGHITVRVSDGTLHCTVDDITGV